MPTRLDSLASAYLQNCMASLLLSLLRKKFSDFSANIVRVEAAEAPVDVEAAVTQ